MTDDASSGAVRRPAPAIFRFRIWQLWLLATFVALAIVNIRDQRRSEPALVALASAGFALYGLLGWAAWLIAGRLQTRLGKVPALVLYLVAMAILFLVATVVYLLIEYRYLVGGGGFARFPWRGWIF